MSVHIKKSMNAAEVGALIRDAVIQSVPPYSTEEKGTVERLMSKFSGTLDKPLRAAAPRCPHRARCKKS